MESFTGPEIAALIEIDRVIVASQGFSQLLEGEVGSNSLGHVFRSSSYNYWFHGVYLIFDVRSDNGERAIELNNTSALNSFRGKFVGLTTILQGQQYTLINGGSLKGVNSSDLQAALHTLSAPATLLLTPAGNISCADDHVCICP